MAEKPTYEELKRRVMQLEKELTERAQLEETFREKVSMFEDFLEKAADGICVCHNILEAPYVRFTHWNPRMTEITGYTMEEINKLGWYQTMYPDPEVQKRAIERMARMREGNHIQGEEWMIVTKIGEKRPVSISTSIVKEEDEKIFVLAVMQNISERKRAEEALRQSEIKYSALVENSKDGIIMISEGVLTFVNKASIELVGYSPEEMIGTNFLNFVAADYKALVLKRYKDRIEGKAVPSIYEIELFKKDGKTVRVELNAIRIDFENKPANLVFIRDITRRKESEESVRESESKFRALFDLSPQAIALTETEKGRLIDVNDKFCELTKYSKEEVVGLTTTELGFYSEENRIRFITELKTYGEVTGLEMDFKAKNGSILNALMFAKIIRIAGESFILTIFLNITEQKKLEGQLQQAQKMEAMGTLAGGIAHDFNNLLMGIQGRTSLMLMDSDFSHSHFEHLKGIEDYIKSAADLTKQLLSFARGGKYEVKPTELNELIKNENRMFGRTRKEINIQEKFEENLWTVEVDRRQIEQVLLNIYVNAWQAMLGGGNLYIQTENIIIDENYSKPYQVEPGNYVKISITDTGVGMDAATRQRIFDPFFTTKEIGRGTGLGLASAYGIIQNHFGFINVYSEKGEGTTFNIYLPASEKGAVKEKALHEELFRGTGTLLLVDDEDMIVDVGCGIIEKLGYKILTAKSGKEAIGIYEKNQGQIDMVILDMIMPEMDGGNTYDRLKEINPNIKVLLSSGYSINGQATEILERGCNGFIQKPFSITNLSQKIREILDKD